MKKSHIILVVCLVLMLYNQKVALGYVMGRHFLFRGDWITDTKSIMLEPAAYFRKKITVKKNIKKATAYIAVAGLYELYLNGRKVGDHILDPMYTRFDRRSLYVTYDVTNLIVPGENVIGVLLGNGWYNLQSTAVWYFDRAPWRARPCFCMDLCITYSDESTETISSGKDWKTTRSPIIFNSIYTGEHYDARKDIPNWNIAGFDDSKWADVIITGAPSKNIIEQKVPPIRATEDLSAISMNKINDTDYVFNLGRNISGVCRINLKNEAGTVVWLKYGERLYADGHVDISNIDVHYRPKDNTDHFATDIYVVKGDSAGEIFQPRFTYHGFQYVEVTSSRPICFSNKSLTGIFLHSDVKPVGKISLSNPIINKLWAATNSSYLSNLMGYPTDCPQREKNGWTGDAHFVIEAGLYNFDGNSVYEKWLADLRDEQQSNGMLPGIVPSAGWGYEHYNTVDWLSALVIIPWELYRFYGNSQTLRDNYQNMTRYIDHLNQLYPDGLTPEGLGDREAIRSHADIELTSTAYYYQDVVILAKAARLFHQHSAEKKYTQLAQKIKRAFNRKFFHRERKCYGSGYQTENSAALYWDLVPGTQKAQVAATLAKSVTQDSLHLDIGVLGSVSLLNALSENGYTDLAFQLASKETYPSWGYWMKQGMTTLPENWNMQSSLNHIFFGEISAWFYKGLGGINIDENKPGFKHIWLQPHIINGLDSFYSEHESPYGKISSGWKTGKNVFIYTATIPPNTTADLKLDLLGKIVKKVRLKPGSYSWRFKPETMIPHFHQTVMLTSKDAVVGQGSNR